MKPRKIILDVDTGTDDAIAIMAALLSEKLQVEAICSVMGNLDIDKTTENTLRVVEFMGASVPVYRGCRSPLVKELCPDRLSKESRMSRQQGRNITSYGKDAADIVGYFDLPAATIKEQPISAPEFYVQYLREAEEPVTIVAVGPLTNLAMALLMRGDIVDNIQEIVVMGGGYNITNSSPTAEYNIWCDPEAAQHVINCGAKVTLVPLDATHRANVTLNDCRSMRKLNLPAAEFVARLCEERITVYNDTQPQAILNSAPIHDALCVAYLLDPQVLRDIRHVHCDIGFRDFCEGQTILDMRYYTEPKNCYFAFDADRERFMKMLLGLLAKQKN